MVSSTRLCREQNFVKHFQHYCAFTEENPFNAEKMKALFNSLTSNLFNIRTISQIILIIIINISIINLVNAGAVNWDEVEATKEGRQWVDLGSIRTNKSGNIEVLTRFRPSPNSKGKTPSANLFLMQINCKESIFRDTYVNGLPKINREWKSSKGDRMIENVLHKICNQSTS